jgi:hypothetical protein
MRNTYLLVSLVLIMYLASLGVSGWWFLAAVHDSWTTYWLLRDGRTGTAVVTSELWSGHNQVAYTYRVNDHSYKGTSRRNWKDKRYENVRVGEESIAYFSASHPWLSLLYKPDGLSLPLIAANASFMLMLVLCLPIILLVRATIRGWKSMKRFGPESSLDLETGDAAKGRLPHDGVDTLCLECGRIRRHRLRDVEIICWQLLNKAGPQQRANGHASPA